MKRLQGKAGVQQRLRIRIRDKYTCQHCGRAVRTGNVDHIIALDNNGTNDDDNLQLLCIDCHDAKTKKDLGYKERTSFGIDGFPIDSNHHWNKP